MFPDDRLVTAQRHDPAADQSFIRPNFECEEYSMEELAQPKRQKKHVPHMKNSTTSFAYLALQSASEGLRHPGNLTQCITETWESTHSITTAP